MLSLFGTRLLNLRFEPERVSESEDEDTISVDIDALSAFVLPLPDIPWRGVAGICGRTITPIYRSLQNMLHEDTEHVARLFSELEPFDYADLDFEPCVQSTRWTNVVSGRVNPRDVLLSDKSRRQQSGSLSGSGRVIIPSFIPTIVITPPYLPHPSETFSRVPFQDSSFGYRLTVPAHPAFNEVFPPLIPTPYPLVPVARNWAWVDGHWQAVLPTLEEQARKGMFSRVRVVKRKSCRRIGSRNTP